MPDDIVERMKAALRPFAALAHKQSGVGKYTLVHLSLLDEARAILADAEKLGKPVLYPSVPATDEWPGRGAYLVIPVLDQPKEPV